MHPNERADTSRPLFPSLRFNTIGSPLVLLVTDLLHPVDGRAVELFLDSDVAHSRGGRGAVPVLLVGGKPHHITGTNVLDRSTLTLNPAATGGDDQCLAERMRVPRSARPNLEGYEVHADAGRVRRIVQRINPHGSREILGWPLAGRLGADALYFHYYPPSLVLVVRPTQHPTIVLLRTRLALSCFC